MIMMASHTDPDVLLEVFILYLCTVQSLDVLTFQQNILSPPSG